MKRSVRAVLLGATALSAWLAFAPVPSGTPAFAQSPAPVQTNAQSLRALPDFSDLAATVTPAVVQIAVTATEVENDADVPPQFRGTPFAQFFNQGRSVPHKVRGLGSGFVVDPQGYIVTNYHVAGTADEIQVVFADGSRLPARRIGADQRTDLALLKVDPPKPLASVAFGDSDAVRVGQWVLAVGNPFGLGGTVTAGIVSARSRDIGSGPYDDFLQIDAAINQGNSGGPTFDRDGNVVGINTAIYSPNGGSVGLGFAIPSNVAKKVVAQLRDHGRIDRAWLGVQSQKIDKALAAALKLPEANGALIGAVDPNGPAAKAGLKRGDVILALDGKAIVDPRDLARRVGDMAADTRAVIGIWRDGKRNELNVSLGLVPKEDAAQVASAASPTSAGAGLGIRLARTPKGEVVVADLLDGGPGEQAGLRPGDRIVEIDRKVIHAPEEVVAALHKARTENREAIAMYIQREGTPLYLAVPIQTARG
ncbi:MAG: Do family serine endopeptidase [Proteobacteria bacterium]|nr:Do family serine endopeptidase [Pseudomonadota bacterium]